MESNKVKIKLVVFKEHTFGYIHLELPDYVQVLHSSILEGATFDLYPDSKLINDKSNVRLATEKDFEEFRIDSMQYQNDLVYDYEYNTPII